MLYWTKKSDIRTKMSNRMALLDSFNETLWKNV